MQVLKYIEDSFNSFNLRIKIELIILPLLILGILIFFTTKPNKEKRVSNPNIFERMKALEMKEEMVSIIKNIENYANKNFLKIKSISSDNKNIKIELFANKKNQIKFIKYLEDYNSFSKIKTLFINQRKLDIELTFQELYFKNKIDLENKIAKLEQKTDINFKLKAIIDKKVLINNKWLKINEVFNKHKLIKINANSVLLENEFETILLKIYKNENI
ncbi:MAG: hypothetical protein WBF48_08975 [Halarcobacter sp.]